MEKIYESVKKFIETSKNISSQDKIFKALDFTLNLYDADRACIFELYQDILIGSNTYELCKNGIDSVKDSLQEISFDVVPCWTDVITSMNTHFINDIEDIKDLSKKEYEILKKHNIKKMIAVPFKRDDFLGFLVVENPRNVLDDGLLKMFSTFIVQDIIEINLLEKKHNSHCPYVINENDIYVSLLGNLELVTYYNDFQCNISSSKQCMAFLIYLLIHRNDYISIERITKTVWGNSEVFEPYQYVKNMVFRARKALDFNDIIIPNNGSYKINPKYNIVLDIELIDSLYNKFNEEKDINTKISYCEQILELYKGNLNELLYDYVWLFNLSTNYHKKYLEILKYYLEFLIENKDYKKIISFCSDRLALDTNEPLLHNYIILAHYYNGDIKTAKLYLDHCGKIFTEEEYNKIKNLINNT